MTYRIIYCGNILAAFLFSLVSIMDISQREYYEKYTDVNDLQNMTTYEMVRDSYGLLCVGPKNGLVSYDGENYCN